MGRLGTITRRGFLVVSAAVAGGAVFGYLKYRQSPDNPLLQNLGDDAAALTPYVRVDSSGITVIVPRAEMGQGVRTTLAALVAEELDVSMDAIRVEHGPASNAYYNSAILAEGVPFAPTDNGLVATQARHFMDVPAKFLGLQLTGGSSSVPDAWEKHRHAGAAARAVLIEAAARVWSVPASSLSTQDGAVVATNGQRLDYTTLAAACADIDVPDVPELKARDEWRLLGKSLPREDMLPKCTGTAQFSIDVQLDNMLYATVRTNPGLGGYMKGFDAAKASGMAGVEHIVPVRGGIAVVARNTWYALQAAKTITFDWYPAPYPDSTEEMFAQVEASFTSDAQDSRMRDDGDVSKALASASAVIEAEYRVPHLAHAAMEPLNATALYHAQGDEAGRIEVWVGTQFPTQVVKEVALIAGVDESNVTVNTTLMGGGFGRRAEMDYVKQAAETAVAIPGMPIKLTWSREEDTTHDAYRPLAIARLRGSVKDSTIDAMDLQLASPSVMESQMGRLGMNVPGPDATIVQGAWEQPYVIDHYRVTGYRAPASLPVSSWRSVGASQNGFFHESAIDELAFATGVDPLEFRLQLINHEPSRTVLEAVRDASGWGEPLPDGHARGVAFVLSFGVPCAQVIEVRADAAGITLVHAWAAVDVGIALDPRNIEAQVIGGLNFGLAAAMYGEITVADGRVEQTNFHDYPSLRFNQAPPVHVSILEHGEHIRGIGEPGTPPAAPALGNAIFAATGQRIRELPFRKQVTFV